MTTLSSDRELALAFTSMASPVELRVIGPGPTAHSALDRAATAIRSVATQLTRFEPTSALSQMNQSPSAWHRAPAELAEAVAEAQTAHRLTGGLFDPRVLGDLLRWGYDRTFDEVPHRAETWDVAAIVSADDRTRPAPWAPTVLPGGLVHLDGVPIDLGGIGKGLAVRRAAHELTGAGTAVLIDAGGDQWLGGAGPDGDGWHVGVEDPFGGSSPVLVLRVRDLGCATSSIARRRWTVDGTGVHHLIDPRTAAPGGAGLAAVTVLDPDPAWAEVWAKTLFLTGVTQVAAEAEVRGLPAAWVTADGQVEVSSAMAPHLIWQVRR